MKKWTYHMGHIQQVDISFNEKGQFTGFTPIHGYSSVFWDPSDKIPECYTDTKEECVAYWTKVWEDKIVKDTAILNWLKNEAEKIEKVNIPNWHEALHKIKNQIS
ncbi:hypothetical protein C4577_03115 [Candidatus Parcubacteria bacterium]|nr:MAG: hypothetical protein C4577_03115 [Candidatus Parcubacteria bacterium]